MDGPRRVLYEITQASQAVVQFLLGRQMSFCRAAATLPVGSGPVVGIVRLPLQFDGLRARILQVMTRCIIRGLAVVDFPGGNVEAFAGAFHFVLATGLVLLSLCQLVHRPVRFG